MEFVDSQTLRDQTKALMQEAEANGVVVVRWTNVPEAVLLSPDRWESGCAVKDVADSELTMVGTREMKSRLHELRTKLWRGHHTVVTFHNKPRAVLAPYAWAREVFPTLDLPEAEASRSSEAPQEDGPGQVMVVYRSRRTLEELAAEFAEADDPDWEIDRRLSASRSGPLPRERRERLRGLVYVTGGEVTRVRAVDPAGQWQDDPSGRYSLAPVSAPLTVEEIDAQLPTLQVYPGQAATAGQGSSREYLDL